MEEVVRGVVGPNGLTERTVAAVCKRIDERIAKLQREVLECVSSEVAVLGAAVDEGAAVCDAVDGLAVVLDDMEAAATDKHSSNLSSLLVSVQAWQSQRHHIGVLEAEHASLTHLASCHTHVQHAHAHAKHARLVAAVHSLCLASSALAEADPLLPDQHAPLCEDLRQQVQALERRLCACVVDTAAQIVVWDGERGVLTACTELHVLFTASDGQPRKDATTAVIRLCELFECATKLGCAESAGRAVATALAGDNAAIAGIFAAASKAWQQSNAVGSGVRVERSEGVQDQWDALGVAQLLDKEGREAADSAKEGEEDKAGGVRFRAKVVTLSVGVGAVEGDALGALHSALSQFARFVHADVLAQQSELIPLLTHATIGEATAAEGLWDVVGRGYRQHMLELPSPPPSTSVPLATALEALYHRLGFCAKTDELTHFTQHLDQHVCASQQLSLLSHTRRLLCDTEFKPRLLEAPCNAGAAFAFPQCHITESVFALTEMLRERAAQASSTSRADTCKHTLRGVVECFRLCVALCTVRGSSVVHVPHVCMLLHNDMMWLAHTARVVAASHGASHPNKSRKELCRLLALSPSLQAHAAALHAQHMSSQQTVIRATVSGDLSVAMFKRVASELLSVKKAWAVLPLHLRRLSLAMLAEFACALIVAVVLDHGDFDADECEPLQDAIDRFASDMAVVVSTKQGGVHPPKLDHQPGMQPSEEEVFVAEHVGSCGRLRALGALLTARLKDIPDLWERGQLDALTSPEAVRMVECLFTDTPKRDACIARLRE